MDTEQLRARIRAIVAPPADQLVVAFFDPSKSFAAGTFDMLPDNPRDAISTSDLLALTMLDVAARPLTVRTLLRPDFSKHLTAVRDDVDLWAATDEDLKPAYRLWDELIALPDVGPTRASKLLARKRPRLIPIIDSVVRTSYGLTSQDNSWIALREALQERQLREEIDAIRPEHLSSKITTLRLLDVAAWMRGSRSKAAERERRRLCL